MIKKMKKRIIMGLAVLLIAISCGKKDNKNVDKDNLDKTTTKISKDSENISENEIMILLKKYLLKNFLMKKEILKNHQLKE